MFKCQNEFCNKTVQPRQPVNRIITEQREKVYQKPVRRKYGGRVVGHDDVYGLEIVKEICVCPKCYRKLTGKEPKMIIKGSKIAETIKGFNTKPPRRKKRDKWQKKKQETHAKKSTSESTPKKKVIVEKINPIQVIKE